MIQLAQIWRYPLKSISRERLSRVEVAPGGKLPQDRAWAIAHERTLPKLDDDGAAPKWMPKAAFLRGASGPGLQAVEGGLDGTKLHLSHPDLGEIEAEPSDAEDAARLVEWVRPIWPEDKPAPARLVSAPEPLTDTRKPFISLNSLSSLQDLETRLGRRLGVERFRGNLWFDGAEPMAEAGWIGRKLRIGDAVLIVREDIGRCAATSVDTETGAPDIDMLSTLNAAYGHTRFGVYAEVIEGGAMAELDEITLLPDENAA